MSQKQGVGDISGTYTSLGLLNGAIKMSNMRSGKLSCVSLLMVRYVAVYIFMVFLP